MNTNYQLPQEPIGSAESGVRDGVPIEAYRGPLLYARPLQVSAPPLRMGPVSRPTAARRHERRTAALVIALVMLGLVVAMIGSPALGYHLSYLNSKQAELLNSQASRGDNVLAALGKIAAARLNLALLNDANQVSPNPADAVRYARAAIELNGAHLYINGNSSELYLWPRSPGQSVISYSTCPQGQPYPFLATSPLTGICTQAMTLTTGVNFSNPALVKVSFASQWRRGNGAIGHHVWDYQVRNRRYVSIVGDHGDQLPPLPLGH